MTSRIAPLLAFLLALAWSSPARADDPTLDYHTITTPHFWVHYHDGLEAFAHKTAKSAEEAHAILSPLLDWAPGHRTHIVCNDKVDTANGSATVFGRNQILIYAMPPEADSVLGFSDDWIRVLVFHEYVHILHLDTILGIPPLVNYFIGQQWAPNNTLPRWYTEGLATFYESSRTRGGRVNGAIFRTYVRNDVLSGDFFDLSSTSNLPVAWPGGSVAYLYGSFFVDYITRKHGEGFFTEFNHRYGKRIMPWQMNGIAREISGQTFEELYEEWHAFEAGRAVADMMKVRIVGETEVELVTAGIGGESGFALQRPRTNQMWFYHNDHRRAPHYAYVWEGGDVERVHEVESGASKADFTPDGETIVYAQSRTLRGAYRYLDLHAYHLPTGQVRRLTEGERAREPAISPDGKRIVYVRNRAGTMELVMRPFPSLSSGERVLTSGFDHPADSPDRWQQISLPDFSPDGRRVVFSMWRQGDGTRDLWTVDVESGELRRLTDDLAFDIDPHWAADGLVYFSSDRTGIFNVFTIDPDTGEVRQLSNVVTGLVQPRRSHNGRWIYATEYRTDGFEVVRFRAPSTPPVAAESGREGLAEIVYPEVDESAFQTGDYTPQRWLAPLIFQPQIGVVTSGAGFGGAVQSNDPVGHHSWGIAGGYTVGRELTDRGASATLNYRYDRLPVDLSVLGLVRNYPRTQDYFAASDFVPFIEQQYLGRVRASYSFRELVDTLSVSAKYELNYTEFAERPIVEHDPADLEPAEPEQGWFNEFGLSLAYSNRESYPQTISTSSGWSAQVGVDVQDPALGSDYHVVSLSHDFDIALPNPFATRHALGLSVRGAADVSNRESPRSYSVGGHRPQDVLTSVVLQTPRRDLVVRGFEPRLLTGTRYERLSVDYRFPLIDFESGFSTVPVYFRRLKGDVFVDSGTAFDGYLGDAKILTGAGAELVLETLFGYYAFGTLTLGVARGFGELGQTQVYFLFGGGF